MAPFFDGATTRNAGAREFAGKQGRAAAVMRTHEALAPLQAGALAEQLAAACMIAPARAEAALRAATPEFAWRVETAVLSRGGLADIVDALGCAERSACPKAGDLFRDEDALREGEAILALLFGTKDARRALAARLVRQSGVDAARIAGILPHLAVVAMAGLARRCHAGLSEILAQVPPLGRLSRGGPHADLAAILRRSCGAGAYSPYALPRAVHRAIAGRAASRGHSAAVWYVRFMIGRTAARLLRSLVRRLQPAPVINPKFP
jgi:hypothetical protein